MFSFTILNQYHPPIRNYYGLFHGIVFMEHTDSLTVSINQYPLKEWCNTHGIFQKEKQWLYKQDLLLIYYGSLFLRDFCVEKILRSSASFPLNA